ncbi:ABC transporter permease subunit [Rathayibacter sp. VKM Ac-2803]|uniref:ABC transporter permease n=1 Tax=unclassified Rathayibacter TaxID=2609250 RepID=UPI0013592CFD|nr:MULTISPECIES: ABC transporter permease subunit [unclassified Rathayibacter]MWV48614.1 ABC transporter permease subunit [Rathayibacter sp. VKM Ac-2803]MWV60049.1 ABC transporter permease subunit [Rathayibacter sp. VKM Ac-2754]
MSAAAGRPATRPARRPRDLTGRLALRIVRAELVPLAVAVVLSLAFWYAFLAIADVSPLLGKTPTDVAVYLFTEADAAENRAIVFGNLGVTALDALVGYAAGMLVALAIAVLFVLIRSLEATVMPIAMLLKSMPLIVVTPLITLAIGNGIAAVAVVGAVAVFFPALVTVVFGLRSLSRESFELVTVYGGSPLDVLLKVALPTAVPAIFAAAKVAVPSALSGAMLAEWLATGKGLGGAVQRASAGFRYDELWASLAVITALGVVAYAVVAIGERLAAVRFGGQN